MSESGKSVRAVRQLSLQPPAPRRQLIRRQRSAEEEKSLQICVSSLARGKRGTSAKPTFERPKVRVAWKENRTKNEKEVEQVEVVARQIPGRSRPNTGRSRGFIAIDKPSILYSREELAERLRLAWKHRQENKANINIFLAHGTLEERCDSEMSSHATITAPSSPILKNDGKLKTTLSEEVQDSRIKDVQVLRTQAGSYCEDKKENGLSDFQRRNGEVERIDINEVSGRLKKIGQEKSDVPKEAINEVSPNTNIDDCLPNSKKKSINIECLNPRMKALPSIKIENLPLEVEKVSKEDFSSAKQKRASFHSGTNRAFLDPIKSPTIEFRCNSEKDRTTPETKDKIPVTKNIPQKTVADCKSKESGRTKMFAESKESSTDNKSQRTNDVNKYNLTIRRATTNTIMDDKDSFVVDKVASTRNTVEVRCSSVNERNAPSKKIEIQKVEKPRRTSSAPPQRLESNLSNRVQVNIVIDTQNNKASGRSRDHEKTEIDCKNNAIERTDTKVSSGRSVRSAPLKRRSRSAKRRFWGSGKNDEEGKSRNRSSGRAKNSIDSKTIDIVTMVSLVSSADSDSDIENSPRDDKLINELRNKLPTTSIIKTSMNPLSSARKPIKSVSFQKDSFDEDSAKEQQPSPKEEKKPPQPRLAIVNHRGNGGILSSNEETVSWRTEIPDLTVPVLSLIHDAEETLDVPLTDREKRCLAVPIGDLHDKKRKLLKTRSISSRSEMERQTILSKTKMQGSPKIVPQKVDAPAQVKTCSNISANVKSIFISPSKETVQPVQPMSTEPRFQTNKEKECWHLYRKMCDKGVCVSFDTVLRGMLTPTEYRLRQKELSQDL
ncbi:uncharacterized protein LOC100882702 [Megachile rotundata]|uniref:uncharacterized protein LOC100882702 n=1 Tax=Megachile rotundata TaxID=143995 RepID=UPI000614A876|nr:PREDICTED: uncharacterized protein LOC100882702 [Megachile rotundata]